MLKHDELLDQASKLKIDKIGVSQVHPIRDEHLRNWLGRAYHGEMGYMAKHMDKRLDPAILLPGAKSIISVFMNYHQAEPIPELDGVISRYARSVDYHVSVKDVLHDLAESIFSDKVEGLSRKERARVYRVFVDSAPVMEKYWAVQSGIGWMGKHTNIIDKKLGSWGFLGEIITTEEIDQYDEPVSDHCGTCTACIDACPTDAIVEPYVVDGSKCISYATIELGSTEPIPGDISSNMDQWIFGCDICQEVCPWNNEVPASTHRSFKPVLALADGNVPDFMAMDQDKFETDFGQTPLERPGLAGMQRNQGSVNRD